MSRIHSLVLVLLCVCVTPAIAGQSSTPDARKEAQAARVDAGSIRLDGRLDDEAWQKAIPITDFLQAEPVERAPTTDHMEIRFLYDDTALWIGARMDNSGGIQAPMSRRDDGDQAEYIQIELDTYLDRRTAYMFGVTASGVRLDHFHPTHNQSDIDAQFDPVWEAKTSVNEHGWTAELWLPFSQLRFNDQSERVWGMNVKRWQPLLNEQDYWVVVGRTEVGWASRFGELRGIDGVEPKKRLELLPYVSSSSRMTANRDLKNPFDNGVNLGGRVGADMKVGIGSNLTLEATINPDFGQIEADPAEVNLTVFETTFSERRPFFIEGNSVLVAGTGNYYYSRRIGARPTPTVSGDYVDYPDVSTILGAAKLTGRFRSGTSVGFLGAVTDEESAEVSKTGLFSNVEVAPRTAWGLGRVIQEFGKYKSTVGAHMTLVHRDLEATNPLAALQVRSAITTGVDTRLRFGNRNYEATGNIGLTFLDGEPAAIARVQNASTHYLQRLDQPTIRYDPTRRALNGTQVTGGVNKVGGRHWLWGTGTLMIESPEFDPQDRNATGSKTAWSGSVNLKTNEYDERSWDLTGSISARPSPSVQFSVEPEYLNETGTSGIFSGPIGRQYLTVLNGGRPETYGKRYVFGLVDRTTLSAQFRFNYTFKPDVTLDVYAEPFAASGQYRGFGELAATRSRNLRIYGTDGTTIARLADGSYTVTDGASTFALSNRDFNNLSFRSNVVLRWEWRPGSTLYAVWQQNRASSVTQGDHVGVNDLFGSLSAPGDNIFALKTTIWLAR